jgi:hypothetical protein
MDRTSGHKIQRTALISRPKTPIIGRALRAPQGPYFTADIDAQGDVQVMNTNRSVLPGLLTAVFIIAAIGPAAYGQLSERAEFLNAVEDGAHRKVKLMSLGTMNIDARNENGTPALVIAVRNGDDVAGTILGAERPRCGRIRGHGGDQSRRVCRIRTPTGRDCH